MAGAKTHDYHILPPSIWPFMGSMSALTLASGAIMWMHSAPFGGWVFMLGVLGVLFTMYSWWSDVIREAHAGDHTPVVSLHLRYGMILFIASEVMFFVAWFWAWFDAALYPNEAKQVARAAFPPWRTVGRGAIASATKCARLPKVAREGTI